MKACLAGPRPNGLLFVFSYWSWGDLGLSNKRRARNESGLSTPPRRRHASERLSMLTQIDFFISWSVIGALAGAVSYLTGRRTTENLFGRMFDGVLGACVTGEIVHRWDASVALGPLGLIAAAAGSVLFLFMLDRWRPAGQ